MSGTLTRPNMFQRLRAAFSPSLIHPAQMQSFRMPDLERWNMPHRSVDMADWEVALNMAKNLYRPDRTKLMDLYDSILKDAHLGSLIETRELRVQGAKYKLVDQKGESKPEHARMLEAPWFLDFVKYVLSARFEGHTLIELGELKAPGQLRQVNKIDPRNVLPYSGVVAKRQGEETGYLFREEPLRTYLIEVGRPEDLGLLERVAPVAVVKKYAVGSWSAFTGSYGIPARWVKTRGTDARRVKQLENVMQNMLSSAYAVIQGDEEFGIAPTPSTSPDALFDKLISRMNSEMSKRLMGQDGTTDNKDASGTYGSMKVLEGVAEDRHESDKTFVSHVINMELLPRLVALGYPFAGLRFEWDEFRDMSAGELVDAVAKLAVHYDIDPQHIEERTGIKILGARRMPGEIGPGTDPDKTTDPDAPAPEPLLPAADTNIQDTAMNGAQVQSLLELITKVANGEIPESVARPILRTAFPKIAEERINEMLTGMKDMPPKQTPPEGNPPGNGKQSGKKKGEGEDAPTTEDDDEDGATAQWPRAQLGSCGMCGGKLNVRAENTPEVAVEALEQLLRDTHGGAAWSQSYFEEVRGILSNGLASRFSRGLQQVSYDQPDHVAYAAMEANLTRFSAAKTLSAATELNAMVRKSTGFADFKRLVDESGMVDKYNRRWLATEYQTAVNTGLQASRWFDIQRNADALPFVEYWTQGDAQVRPVHAALDGKRWPVNHPILATIAPPNGDGCRCTLVSSVDGPAGDELVQQTRTAWEQLEVSGEYDRMKKRGYDKNKAITGEVFDLNRSYLDQLDKGQAKKLALNVEQSYGADASRFTLESIEERTSTTALPGYNSAEEALRVVGDTKVIPDAQGRPWTMSRSMVQHHLSGKYASEERYRTLHLVPEVIAKPDEVWLTSRGGSSAQYAYIKYYKGMPVVVRTEVSMGDREPMRISSWYPMKAEKAENVRNGILVKRMPG